MGCGGSREQGTFSLAVSIMQFAQNKKEVCTQTQAVAGVAFRPLSGERVPEIYEWIQDPHVGPATVESAAGFMVFELTVPMNFKPGLLLKTNMELRHGDFVAFRPTHDLEPGGKVRCAVPVAATDYILGDDLQLQVCKARPSKRYTTTEDEDCSTDEEQTADERAAAAERRSSYYEQWLAVRNRHHLDVKEVRGSFGVLGGMHNATDRTDSVNNLSAAAWW